MDASPAGGLVDKHLEAKLSGAGEAVADLVRNQLVRGPPLVRHDLLSRRADLNCAEAIRAQEGAALRVAKTTTDPHHEREGG